MERIPQMKMLQRRVPPSNHVAYPKISAPKAQTNRPESPDSGELEFSVTVWNGKPSLQDQDELVPGALKSKGSAGSIDDGGSVSFSGASHPPEPVDTDSLKPVRAPIGQKNPGPGCLVKSLSVKGSFLDDLSIKEPCKKPSLAVQSSSEEKDCVWDSSLPPSGNVSPLSVSASTYRTSDGMLSIDRTCVRGDSIESAKTSMSRVSYSSGLSDDSNWSNLTRSGNKPHQGNDPIWKAIMAVRGRDGVLGMGHFRLLKRLGCGDIGSVYLSELSGTRCYFAMKVMDKASLAARKKLIRSQTEREILQLLDHPFLPTLYSHFETDRFACLVMEYCPGGDLHTLRQRQPGKHFSEYAARFYAAEVLLAMEYLHMLGIIYRDLKPENVLVREDGHIMLSDFDLSLQCTVSPTLVRNSDSGSSNAFCAQPACIEPSSACVQPACFIPGFFNKKNKTKTRQSKSETRLQSGPLPELVAEPTQARSMSFVGTHEYLAPEIIKGEGHGSAVDWWTFGIFLHELLYGKTPFKGSGNRATLFNVVGQQLRFPDSPATSYASRDLIRALLVKEPHNRLGVKRGATEIKQHPFFEGVNWALIRCSTPPEIPRPVELNFPAKAGVVEPPEVVNAGKKTLDTDMKAGGGKFLDFEFF